MHVRRRPVALVMAVAAALAVASATPSAAVVRADTAPSNAYRSNDYGNGQVMSILPPGSNGLVSATDLVQFEAGGTRPAGSTDQRTKYDALNYGYSSLTDDTLGTYYDDESFGVNAADIVDTVSPETGVTIYTDTKQEPHIYADSDATLAFGSGYAQAQDRLFMMDVLRHYGAGTTAAFLGPSCADEQMDHDQLLLAAYTPAQAQAQIDALPTEYGAQGTRAKTLIENYVLGINAYITAAETNPALLPADYGAAGVNVVPQPWTAADVVSVAGLVGGIFGKGGGIEVADSALYTYLVGKLGTTAGQAAYNEFKSDNDPAAPTTIVDKTFPYEQGNGLGSTVPTALNDLPAVDPTTHQVVLTGGPTDTTANCDLTNPDPTGLLDIASLAQLPKAFSNALVVNADHSKDGHPIAVFGPQVSYFAPEILTEMDMHSPGYDAQGVGFPGTGLVELGRGEDYAWSATSAGTDLIDQRLEQVCDPAGGKPTADEPDYLFNGVCTPMTAEDFTETGVPSPAAMGAPVMIDHSIYLTNHGIVQGWTTDQAGNVVAVVEQRSTYNHDVDSVVGFLDWGDPAFTHDATSWMQGATQIEYTFNWLYVDDRDTAYYVSGLDPVRPTDLDPDLPATGNGTAEWQGYLPDAEHPHEINPPQGFFDSWNNKPAPGFSAADDMFGYGKDYRVQMLTTQIQAQFAANGNKITRAQLVQAMSTAATQDLDGLTEIKDLLAYLKANPAPAGTPANDATMISLLQTWVDSGAHRHKAAATDTEYQQAAAVAISDELIPDLVHAIWDPLLSGGGSAAVGSNGGATAEGFGILPMQFTNTPNSGGAHLGSAYDSGWEGYIQDTLEQLMGQTVGDPFSTRVQATWCGSGPTSCPTAIWGALTAAEKTLETANGGQTDPTQWDATTATQATAVAASATNPTGTAAQTMPEFDAIYFRAIGIVGQTPMDWQNRPTFQQVVEYPSHRDRATATTSAPVVTSAPTTGTGSLASTGGLPLAGLAVLLVGGAAMTRRRRRG